MIPSAGKHAEQREARDLEARTVRQDPPSRDRGSGLCAPSRGPGMFTTPSRNHPRADEQRAVQTQRWQARREPQGTAEKTAPVTPGSPTGGFLSRWAPRGRPRGGTWVLGAPRSGPGGVHTTAPGSQTSPQSVGTRAGPSVLCQRRVLLRSGDEAEGTQTVSLRWLCPGFIRFQSRVSVFVFVPTAARRRRLHSSGRPLPL